MRVFFAHGRYAAYVRFSQMKRHYCRHFVVVGGSFDVCRLCR